ncbi:MAG: ABC transporter permease [Oscillospiraceae bacterium]|jgi:spermidine/putrescine transport system permease protein|nr:ABC transporter permease [Oscillospiraceae bacterium]
MKAIAQKQRRGLSALTLNTPYLFWCLVFVLVPLGMVAFFSFHNAQGEWTLDVFRALIDTPKARRTLFELFGVSILYALIATIICLFLAYPLAYYMSHATQKTQRNLMTLIMVPMLMNFVICTYCWVTILANEHGIIASFLDFLNLPKPKLLGTPGAVILGMVYNFLPYMIMPLYSVMSKVNPSLVEAAQDLGATGFGVLRKVTLPLSVPGIISGITMVFVPSVSTFYISQQLGASKTLLIGDRIEMAFVMSNDFNTGAALSLILMLFVVVCMMVMHRFSDGEEGAFVV